LCLPLPPLPTAETCTAPLAVSPLVDVSQSGGGIGGIMSVEYSTDIGQMVTVDIRVDIISY
jgi:hypothetical protein